MRTRPHKVIRAIASPAVGSWSRETPPYLDGVFERHFVRLKEEWLHRTMKIGSLIPSCRVIAYFMADHLNWATMDCWTSHETLAGLVGVSEKTVQRSISAMEESNILSVWRLRGSHYPLRYAPVYPAGKTQDACVPDIGQSRPEQVDASVHQPLLQNLPKSPLAGAQALARSSIATKEEFSAQRLSFKRAERGRLESQVAPLVGGFDVLSSLAAIHDEIVTRICEARCRGELGERQIRATKLAAKQSRIR
jgi:hypothetical protein